MDRELPVAVYDVEVLRGPDETKGGWANPRGMGFGTAVVYFENTDYYGFYGPEHLEKLQADLEDKYVVGFNSVGFDNKVVFGNNYRGAHPREDKSKECDLLLRVVCSKFKVQSLRRALKKHGPRKVFDGSCKLDSIAKATLGMQKTGDGALAPLMIRRNQWAKVFAYNLHDVRITYKLFCFARDRGFLVDGKGNNVRVII
jgi:hypothetical protein